MIDRACISINNTCNLNCRYCHFRQRDKINEDDEFTIPEIELIIKNAIDYSLKNDIQVFKIGIAGAGEPLLSFNKIKDIVEFSEREDLTNIIEFYTITNGTIIDKNMLRFFYEHRNKIGINFSLDGYRELHNYGRANFDDVITGIRMYETVFQAKPIINCTVTRQTINNKEALADYFDESGFKKVSFTQLTDLTDPDLYITNRDFTGFIEFVTERGIISRQSKIKDKRYDCRKYGKHCGVGRTNLFISRHGIYSCWRFYKNDSYKLANFDASFDTIESNMKKTLKSIGEDECYYDKYIS